MAAVLPGLTKGEFPELWELNEMGGRCRSMRNCLTVKFRVLLRIYRNTGHKREWRDAKQC